MDENQARSSVSMFRVGAFPQPPGAELRDQDKVAGSMLAFARAIPANLVKLWLHAHRVAQCPITLASQESQCYDGTWPHCS